MITAILLALPVIAAIILLTLKGKQVRTAALFFSVIEFCVAAYAFTQFQLNATTQFAMNVPWIHSFGINFNVGMDGISLLLVLLTAFLVPLIILASFNHEYENPSAFYALVLLMQTGLTGVFVSFNAMLFYVFWELALIPIYFISAIWGGERRIAVTLKFFIYTVFGSLFMLLGIIYLYLQTPGPHTFDLDAFYALSLDSATQGWLFWAFFIAFAIKIPVFPFHSWQPDTYTEAPAPGTMLLSGIMLKMGLYGVIRWLLPMFPLGVEQWGQCALIISIIGIVYASVLALVQKDVKRLIAYSSIAHVGLIAAGIFVMNSIGLQGGIIQMLNHGVNVVGVFFIIDVIESRTRNRDINSLGGIAHKAPQLAIYFMIVMLASVALPLTNGFIGEFLLLNAISTYSYLYAAIAGLTIILGAIYMLTVYKKVMFGEVNMITEKFTDLKLTEKAVLIPIVFMIFWIGLYPKPFLQVAQPAVENLISIINK